MAVTYILLHKDSSEISRIVKELKDTGFKIGVDFDFAYSPGRWDEMVGEIPKQTEFTFYNEKLATWSILKWSE